MTAQEFATYQEQTFDSYAKRLIRNEGADAKKELARRAKREAQLSALSPVELSALAGEDRYNLEKVTLFVRENEVNIFKGEKESEDLADKVKRLILSEDIRPRKK